MSYPPEASLDHIRRMQDRTRDEYVRQGFTRRSVIAVAIALFVAVASRDLPNPWDGVVSLLAAATLVTMAVVNVQRARIRRRAGRLELGVLAGAAAALLAVLLGAQALTEALDLPAPYTIAGAAVALLSVAAAPGFRRAYAAAIWREDRAA
jgi:peptidoglycan/LPS O-acetylase OafA/YrhL